MGKLMSLESYNFIKNNLHRLEYDLDKGLVITPKGTNGTVCTSTGYLRVRVNKKTLQVHQILAVIYYGEECIGKQVNHLDRNKLNNVESNIEICTQQENLKHSWDTGSKQMPLSRAKIKVDMLDMDGNYIRTYDSINDATRDLGLGSPNSIASAIKGKDYSGRKHESAGGYKWRVTQ